MKRIILIMCCFLSVFAWADDGRTTISLNGEWDFDQTELAFPPRKYTRKIPVPGLVHLARPKISQYEKFFKKPDGVELVEQFNFLERDYTPMYNWYKRKVFIDEKFKDEQLFLTIKKSQYVTRVFVNGHEVGASMECYTPMDFNITSAVKYGSDNEILIQVGDRAWLPSEAAGGTDKEKVHYLPGIWDDVFITATGKMRVDKVLFLPSLAKGLVTVKTLVRSLYPPQMLYGDKMKDSCKIEFCVKEKTTGRIVGKKMIEGEAKRDNRTYFETSISLDNPKAWTPDSPFLYEGEVSVYDQDELVDRYSVNFGMRDFSRKGKFFTLNGDKFYLRGSNITLQRFFEDPDCQALAWDREWVKKLMVDLPKSIDWNAMRICVGIVPDFWYDLCDEYGIVLQNEWLYWQNHGWGEQVRKEYTNWVWSDGNHPSIVIWDAINENWDSYIGNTLIPELKELDPTRIWDAGYMTSDQMGTNDEMDEPHPYRALTLMHSSELNDYFKNNPYNLGALHENWVGFSSILDAGVPQLVNEYGWIWLWRDGRPSKLTLNNYNYYLGENATPEQCRELQAYWLELETEWLRSERSVGGILAFCHLTNNYGFTGDWFINDIKDLEPSPAFRWFKHCFAPSAVFIDLADRRYTKHLEPLKPGSDLVFNLVGVNDLNKESSGKVLLKLLDEKGTIISTQEESIVIEPFGKRLQPCLLKLPSKSGGYLLIAEYHEKGRAKPVLSRRYLKVGDAVTSFKDYFEYTLN
ncbi:glycoside hydrolase family 2 [Parabacteroides distasonis]|uniref:Glycosyl hydrolases family 2, sugar binding domain protein n=1 Tax=Parabacteroides distasonis str. 3776 D15 i TaxID=1339342 RepID=A0AB34LAW2_PARDI|nr:glycoside hydrolase family 2 TIM barrel-domain containing protein [Parabacteroides distasonis]KDS34708.1 glycosyl hydrolases family 2, sugar binding domain protein [Parabacteroides distasonis str. 3776 D15 i]KDS69493.1 glycosyl hydrolases family 2, sugar binding domain protein [Parabacteroides distasonis str. 3776 D15 iv]MCC2777875.1 glycoside hydrolase family 2 [Parabacteroides distasonis]MCQ5179328.1 glycoside hydrolase family 2 [Parabacteroides distasonis]UVR25288.1 glycoside hydrolase f